MRHVVIVAACRTAIGALGGAFRSKSALDLTIPVMQALVQRSGLDPALLDDVIWGCNYQKTYKENNLARVAAVKAGLPSRFPGLRYTATAPPQCPRCRWATIRSWQA